MQGSSRYAGKNIESTTLSTVDKAVEYFWIFGDGEVEVKEDLAKSAMEIMRIT